ncbi:iron-enterobactin ABC transporter permease [Mycetocola reblochoni]|uniref:ABC-type Fe3+-siderophore transport system, permease 2 component n=2 Tax=Mycetocola reblochoni TaxID=331618 RepID=A0A1R4ING8_9MICO|nr:iron chelate uptake ABC transporter family permease subunit [Mycetocola reblochoni]RLP67914.1 iron-enterobactin ABC transporter permease [Mycetocola reblochoni]SJN21185.1 ABC-type Fe3+-siderophore transport system, permease 2 component [Mycetocola reblochoni REB411]
MTGPSLVDFGRARRVLRVGPTSTVVNTRTVVLVVVTLLGGAAAFKLSVSLGRYPVPLDQVADILGGGDHGFSNRVVLEWRLPRALAGIVYGAGLGVAGAIVQSVTRNPLGSPDVVGIGAGAYTGALLASMTLGGSWAVTAAALAGGIGTAVIVFALSSGSGLSGTRFIVVGIAVASALTAVNSILVLRMSTRAATTVSIWGQGTLVDVSAAELVPSAAAVLLLAVLAGVRGPAMRQLELGDGAAASTGVSVGRSRVLLLSIAVLLTAVITSVTGPIAFIALVAPQLARLLTGGGGTGLLGSAAAGALLLAASDVAAAHLFPMSLPVGVVTAVLGGGYLLALVLREARRP